MELQEALTSVLPKPKRDAKGRLECPLMNNGAGGWREPKPEELVRQAFILHLHHHYGYAFEQMLDEQKTQSGRKSSKADIAIWDTPACARKPGPISLAQFSTDSHAPFGGDSAAPIGLEDFWA